MKANIALIGFMGVGKSTIGRLLAAQLGKKFVDTDELVQNAAGKPIHEIFMDGERKFRVLESRALEAAVLESNAVIACAGGSVLSRENKDVLKSSVIIHLTASKKAILDRISLDSTQRPLLAHTDKRQKIDRLLTQRQAVYAKLAHLTVDTTNIEPEQVVKRIIKELDTKGFALLNKSLVHGEAKAPPSKSMTHRTLVCAALSRAKCTIVNPLICDDTLATMSALRKLGARITINGNLLTVNGRKIDGGADIVCEQSGTTLRFISAVCALGEKRSTIIIGKRLAQRPIKPLLDALEELGARCTLSGNILSICGPLHSGSITLPGNISSQFISALMLVSPCVKGGIEIKIDGTLESAPYINLTRQVQAGFGLTSFAKEQNGVADMRYFPAEFEIEADWSSAAFLLAAGALAGKVTVRNLNTWSMQADMKILDVLRDMGVVLRIDDSSVTVQKTALRPIEFDVSGCPDIFPVLCVLCSAASGKSTITGTQRLRLKESDRLDAMVDGLKRMGICVRMISDGIEIEGSRPKGAVTDPRNDHRIAMAFAVLGLIANGRTTIINPSCVAKSFPSFWKILKELGADVAL